MIRCGKSDDVVVVGGGLAGCEAAWQLAEAGLFVRLLEMKPRRRTPAQVSDNLAELVCSNSLRSSNILNAVGLLKEEMRRLGSLIIDAALHAKVPAGDALAVDREKFSHFITRAIEGHDNISRETEVVTTLPEIPCIIATGPLTEPDLAADIQKVTGKERLYFYDAIAPIVSADSIDRSIVFAASRYGKGDGADYLNCPLDESQYTAFLRELLTGECLPLHSFEKPNYFQGCLPVEVIAQSGSESLRFGCMKPVGLRDPRTDRRPHAVVQLRQEDVNGQAYNLVGFQTKLKYPEQQRIFRMIPGLERANFVRLGAIHRNTYLDSPEILDDRMGMKARSTVRFAGQITGVEGYVESSAHGLITAKILASDLIGSPLNPPPWETALGALWSHVRGSHRLEGRAHEPQNINWSMFPPPPHGTKKHEKKRLRVERALCALNVWAAQYNLTLRPSSIESEDLENLSQHRRVSPERC